MENKSNKNMPVKSYVFGNGEYVPTVCQLGKVKEVQCNPVIVVLVAGRAWMLNVKLVCFVYIFSFVTWLFHWQMKTSVAFDDVFPLINCTSYRYSELLTLFGDNIVVEILTLILFNLWRRFFINWQRKLLIPILTHFDKCRLIKRYLARFDSLHKKVN